MGLAASREAKLASKHSKSKDLGGWLRENAVGLNKIASCSI